MATKADVLARLKATRNEIGTLVESTPAEAWAKSAYESWTCLTLLCHIASTSGVASFILTLSRLPARPTGGGAAFDQDAFNAQQAALRAGRSPAAVLDEIAANTQRDIQTVEAASDADLQKHFAAPWGSEGSVAEVIIASHDNHLGMHIGDLRRALA
jgi:Mycothiol maleylpyruvate isomerase N-terminal domain.